MNPISHAFKRLALVCSIAAVFSPCVRAQTSLTNGLMAYYAFRGDAKDGTGNGMDGTVFGATPISDRFGATNSAYHFSGSSWVQLPDDILPVTAPEVTLSLWVLAGPGAYSAQQTLLDLTSRRGECGFVTTPGPVPQWNFGVHLQNSGWQNIQTPMLPNIWTHLVGSYKRGQFMQFWVNGSLVQSNTIPDDTLFILQGYALNTALGIYDFAPAPYSGFNGALDDVRIYNRALSAAEVQQLYRMEAGVAPTVSIIKSVHPSFASLVVGAHYQLQVSGDSLFWTNYGSPFTSTNTTMVSPQYWDVDNWNQVFFRLQMTN